MRLITALLATAALAGCATTDAPPALTLDEIAEAYVKATLEIGTHEEGYVDAYHGPAEWREAAEASPRDKAALKAEVGRLRAALGDIAPEDPLLIARRDALDAQLRAASARLEMMEGRAFSFDEEARLLYGATPAPRDLSSFDAAIARLDALVPGDGPVAARVTDYVDRFVIPDDNVGEAILAATAACKAATIPHIAMPEGEAYELELVRDKVWGGYNWYQGGSQSLIQVNLDSDVTPDEAIILGCHEGYPGHHLFNSLLEQELADKRGWVEYSVYPLYSPQSLIAEGSADYGRRLAFDDAATLALYRDTLFPLAGFDPAEAERYHAVTSAMGGVEEVQQLVSRAYLDGDMTRAEAVRALMDYYLQNEAQAERKVAFAEANRAYVINYALGEQMVEQWIEARVAEGMTHWEALELMLTTPVVLGE
ncbi:hypothetical protein [Sphingomicrobium aestuariivivum]|uniref:hypothetical protein n=1 Tax=Sphingomicrobium aestuariivivum TaxID=1582356 RepID=UPI001FD6B651|nr:hypothetical protein [Sphingomicrobium aestuariivivum]MCJ8190960.1 hypothetical protein [Sphingomicrobium aestuariivivum]